jgi:hypothetical protein
LIRSIAWLVHAAALSSSFLAPPLQVQQVLLGAILDPLKPPSHHGDTQVMKVLAHPGVIKVSCSPAPAALPSFSEYQATIGVRVVPSSWQFCGSCSKGQRPAARVA